MSTHMQNVTTVAAHMSADADNQYQAMTEATQEICKNLKRLLPTLRVRPKDADKDK